MIEALPESTAAGIRYAIALISTLTGALSESQVTQVSTAIITLVTVGYGIYRTHQIDKGA